MFIFLLVSMTQQLTQFLKKHFNKYHGSCLEQMGKFCAEKQHLEHKSIKSLANIQFVAAVSSSWNTKKYKN